MEREKIHELIIKGGDEPWYFAGGVGQSDIDAIERVLSVKLPESYRWFLETYGQGGLFGVDILGIAKNGSLACVKQTTLNRRYGLPCHFVIIEDCGEYQYCLNTGNMDNGECPVVSWAQDGEVIPEAKNFYEFVIDRFTASLENDGLL